MSSNNSARELGLNMDLKFDSAGLITAVTVDADNGQVLMVAFMNREALEKTLATGKATYWSRSRNKFWIKGEESGHTQQVQDVLIDCDQDAVIIKVRQSGTACHNGYRSCFYRRIRTSPAGPVLEFAAERSVDPATVYKK